MILFFHHRALGLNSHSYGAVLTGVIDEAAAGSLEDAKPAAATAIDEVAVARLAVVDTDVVGPVGVITGDEAKSTASAMIEATDSASMEVDGGNEVGVLLAVDMDVFIAKDAAPDEDGESIAWAIASPGPAAGEGDAAAAAVEEVVLSTEED